MAERSENIGSSYRKLPNSLKTSGPIQKANLRNYLQGKFFVNIEDLQLTSLEWLLLILERAELEGHT